MQQVEVLARVASLYYEEEMNQSEIAKLLGVSRSAVSRLLTRARNEKIVQIHIHPVEVRSAELEKKLARAFPLKSAVVIKTMEQVNSEIARKQLGRFAAPFVIGMVKAGDVIGIGRGRTLYELVKGMQAAAEMRDVTVVQLLGDVGPLHSTTRAGELSRILAERLKATCYYLNTPAIVQNRSLRQALLSTEDVRTIFKLHETVRVAILGIGAILDSPLLMGGLLSIEEARKLSEQGIVGDICGHFFDQQGRIVDTKYSELVVGISLEALRSRECVLGLAAGLEKVEVLLGALRGRLINVLVTDDRTAEALLAQS